MLKTIINVVTIIATYEVAKKIAKVVKEGELTIYTK